MFLPDSAETRWASWSDRIPAQHHQPSHTLMEEEEQEQEEEQEEQEERKQQGEQEQQEQQE